ncbi:MAG: pyrroline-5-carboxylate reductase [Ruminococcaceae bacterium]|nr:pyrroline-5-carboxylate reductase [Oscillospiraceae bacterium]
MQEYIMKKTLTFIGCGNMAGAIIDGAEAYSVCLYDKDISKYERFKDKPYITTFSIAEAVEKGDYIFLCVKPQNKDEVLPEIAKCGLEGKMIISIMAGVKISTITKYIGEDAPVVRLMPNTPLMLGKGVTSLTRNDKVTDKRFSDICRLFSEIGEVMIVSEDKIDAVTAASGSAPAYVYLFIKSIADEARAQGLDTKNLDAIIARMVIGSCHMVLESGKTPDELIKMVCSPNGTTERAMKVFEEEKFSEIIAKAMQKCAERSKELSEE